MTSNYKGQKLQKEWLLEALKHSMELRKNDFDKEVVLSWENNPIKYSFVRYTREKQSSYCIPRIADWLNGVAIYEIPVESYKQLELRDKWGYKTNDDVWCNHFMLRVACMLLNLWQKEGLL